MTALGVLWVGLGGGLGSLMRWGVGRLVGERYPGDFPLGTFLINITGAFPMGYPSVLFASTGIPATARPSLLSA